MLSRIDDEYFEWLMNLACYRRFAPTISYRKLLKRLYETEFTYTILRDRNRSEDGKGLRYRFVTVNGYEDWQDTVMEVLNGPCSVLEMILALAIRCEENIMDDPLLGNRTRQWFWGMIKNLGLDTMTDMNYSERFIDDVVCRFLNRDYEPDGTGGLFTVKNCYEDLRTVEIWYQLLWYLDTIT